MDNFNRKLICVDLNDNIVGTEKAGVAHTLKHLTLHRAFSLFLFNSQDELLIQQRSLDKFVFPGLWSNTVCSHPFLNHISFSDPLQDVKNHLIERLKYELGITTVTVNDLHFVTRLRYKAVDKEFTGEILEGLPRSREYFDFKLKENNDLNFSDVQWGEWEIDYIFICRKDVELNPNKSEVADYRFLDEDSYKMFIKNNRITPWKTLILKYVDIFELVKKI